MNTRQALEQRLADLAASFSASDQALALLGLGSVGLEIDRLDAWSDLDFFAIVKPGSKKTFLDDTSWLAAGNGVDWLFRNTADGFKLAWTDGIFGEMAVFEPQELANIPFAPGRIVWAADGFDTQVLIPVNGSGKSWAPPSVEHARGELLSCLYVGLCRYRRGEKLSAWRFVQSYCLDRFLELTEMSQQAAPGFVDPYSRDRRFEFRYPAAAEELDAFLGGYESTPRAALAFLSWLEQSGPVNPTMARMIRELAQVA